jgi:hypothetical protein
LFHAPQHASMMALLPSQTRLGIAARELWDIFHLVQFGA